MGLKLITPPAATPIALADAKAHLRVDFADDDASITAYLNAAVDYVDGPGGFLGRALVKQTWQLTLDAFPCANNPIELPLPPLISVAEVKNGSAVLDPSQYRVDTASEPGRVFAASSWPSLSEGDQVSITFTAGYVQGAPEAEAVPFSIKAAILLLLGTLYENRASVVIDQSAIVMPWAAEQLLRRYRFDLSIA